ncbi:protein hemingway isoform X2 [Bradysia coprophila]|uniref:protein hemingway isoform X2 n=1 Tax=Bradysia coprophila TaxID=38358 RepID=UPI00187D83ED|nr:protein hemingway isoform X2 [Bradysia coprophila]
MKTNFISAFNQGVNYDMEEIREENSSINEESYANETFSSSSSNGDRVLSSPPSEYDERNRLFHLNFIRRLVKDVSPIPKKYKNGTRASLSFSNDQMRDIERSNRILLSKILSQQPSSHIPSVRRNDQFADPIKENVKRVSSATVNRRRKQVEIDAHNQLLKRKIEKIARRKSTN